MHPIKFTSGFFRPVLAAGLLLLALAVIPGPASAADGEKEAQQGPRPALVVTAKSSSGSMARQAEYIGSVFFPEVSDVAAEVNGRVASHSFEEGETVKAGQVLARLSTDILEKELASKKASLERAEADLQLSEIDFKRTKELFAGNTVSEQEYDNSRFSRIGNEKNVQALRADVERIALQIQKAVIRAPFDGVVLDRACNRGEWLGAGSVVGTIARNDYVDAVVEVPESQFAWVKKGAEVPVKVAGRDVTGRVVAVILKGDTATRTFPVKVRVREAAGLAEGMEVRVSLPVGEAVESVLVPRDGVVRARGMDMVWINDGGAAKMIPVQVIAFQGLKAAVRGEGLTEGMDVVIKGNERLRPGQPLMPASGGKPAPNAQ